MNGSLMLLVSLKSTALRSTCTLAVHALQGLFFKAVFVVRSSMHVLLATVCTWDVMMLNILILSANSRKIFFKTKASS